MNAAATPWRIGAMLALSLASLFLMARVIFPFWTSLWDGDPGLVIPETDLVLLRVEAETFLSVLDSHADVGLAAVSLLASSLMQGGWGALSREDATTS